MGRIALPRKTRKRTASLLSQHIGEQLLGLRQKHGVTMRDVGDGTGLSAAFVCDLENGHCSPSADTLWALAEYFETRPSYFFRGFKQRPM
jgi:transcriptional regulator with XRE-family HTH domain